MAFASLDRQLVPETPSEQSNQLGKSAGPDPSASYRRCVAKDLACPLEDIGDIPGNHELIAAAQEMLDELDTDFDPEAFDLAASINSCVR